MCKIKTKHHESSFTSVFIVVKTLSSVLIVASVATHPFPPSNQNLPKNDDTYSLNSNSPSFSEYNTHHVPLNKESKVDNFEQIIHDFYSELLAHQEPLGEQFEAVLFNNLWDLYED